MPEDKNENIDSNALSWKAWFQIRLVDFCSVHFVITLLILSFWIHALSSPLEALSAIYLKIGVSSENVSPLTNALGEITGATVTISGIFTTLLGVVLGHYFGQRGQAAAEQARELALDRSNDLVDDIEESSDFAEENINELTDQITLSNAAVDQLLGLVQLDALEVDEDSPLAKLLLTQTEDV